MKKSMKNLLSLLLAALMLLSLAACGGEEEKADKEEEDRPEFVYTAEFTQFGRDEYGYMDILNIGDSEIYIQSEEKVGEEIPEGVKPEYEDQYAIYETRLLRMDLEGKLSPLSEYKANEPEAEDSDTNIAALFISPDGNIITLESRYSSSYTGPENLTKEDEEYWMYVEGRQEYFIKVLDGNGAELSSTQLELPEDSYLNKRNIAMDKDGNLVIATDFAISVFKNDGSRLFDIPLEDKYIDKIITLRDGTVLVNSWGQEGPEFCPVDMEAKKLGDSIGLPSDAYDIYPGGDKYDICYKSGSRLYGLNIGEEPVKILNWVDVDINSDNIESFRINADGSIVGLSNIPPENEKDTFKVELFKLSPVPYDSAVKKQELSFAVMWPDQGLTNAIVKYNRGNPESRIVLKDYSEFNTEDDWEAGRTKLMTEIMSGELPDMLALGNMPYKQLASKGILIDLYPYLDTDKEIKRGDIYENVMKAAESDGKLCQITPSFNIITAGGSARVVGDVENWNYERFNEALASMPEGCQAFGPYTTKSAMLSNCLNMDMDLYADWSTGKCSFDSPEFISLLKFADRFPKDFDWEHYEPGPEDNTADMIASGRQMLVDIYISNFDDIVYNDLQFGGDAVYVGYPSAQGGGSVLSINESYGITSDCRDKDAAWNFLKQFLSEEFQQRMYWGLPVNKNVFEEKLKEAMTPEYLTDENGNFVLDENGEKIKQSKGGISFGNGVQYEIYEMSEQQAEKLRDLLKSTSRLSQSDYKLIEIVLEEAKPFFEGQKSAEEVAKLIQSKVNIYINEQR